MEKTHVDTLAKSRIPNFMGVYNIDSVQKPKHLPAAYIINTLASESPKLVGHWVAMIIKKMKLHY